MSDTNRVYIWCWGAESARMDRLPVLDEVSPDGLGVITAWRALHEREDYAVVGLEVRYPEHAESEAEPEIEEVASDEGL